MLKPLIFTLVLFATMLVNSSVCGQRDTTTGVIAGNIIDDNTQKALEGVTVSIKRLGDTNYVRELATDANGEFIFESLNFGYYRINFSTVGYGRRTIDSIFLRSERNDFNLPDIKLYKTSSQLDSVIIYAERPLYENKDGKITFNASESAMSNTATTTELLKQTPLVSVDGDVKLTMKGKEVKVLIDDKPVELNQQQLQDLLESMPGSMIEKIEVLTTPPPQYATERAGIINIVTKKSRVGFGGRLNTNYGTRGEYGLSGNVSYRKNKLSVNVSGGFSYNEYVSESYSLRSNIYTDSTNRFNTNADATSHIRRYNARLATDYEFNKQNSIGLVVQPSFNTNRGESLTDYININRFDTLYKLSNRDVNTQSRASSLMSSLNFSNKAKKNAANVFKAFVSYTISGNNLDRNFFQQFLQPDYTSIGLDSTQHQVTDLTNRTIGIRLSYDWMQGKKWFLGVGLNGGFYETENEINTTFLQKPQMVMVLSDRLSNQFTFYQNVYAARFSARYNPMKDFFITVGMQQEYSTTWFDIRDTSANFRNNYFSPLPFVTITKKWREKYNFTGSYKRSVQRPGINNLNPSIDYSDPYNTRYGNPLLQPYYADNFDLSAGYTVKKFNLNVSVGYNSLSKIFSQIRTLATDGKTNVTWENLSGRKEYESSIWGGVNLTKKLKLNASAAYVYSVYSAHDKAVNKFRDGGTLTSSLNGNFTANPLTSISGSYSYNRFANPQGRVRNALSMNFGIQRKFLKKKLNVSLSVVDPFRNQQNRNFTTGRNFELESFSQSRSKNLRIGLAYTFSKQTKKPLKKLPLPANKIASKPAPKQINKVEEKKTP